MESCSWRTSRKSGQRSGFADFDFVGIGNHDQAPGLHAFRHDDASRVAEGYQTQTQVIFIENFSVEMRRKVPTGLLRLGVRQQVGRDPASHCYKDQVNDNSRISTKRLGFCNLG